MSSYPKLNITETLVRKLIEEQFPQWSHLPIKTVEFGGRDNYTFHLGREMSIRLPSAEDNESQVPKEHKWLPLIAPHLPLPIPTPIAIGMPSEDHPHEWSIYKWLDGKSANAVELSDEALEAIALQLAKFVTEFHKLNSDGAPTPGLHNWWRAAHTSTYDSDTRELIIKLEHLIDASAASALWEEAVSSKWENDPVWVHGDVASGNILVRDNKLSAVIDFGCMGIGDPACDLTIAWTFFRNKSREIFRNNLNLDIDTWTRARGWALWKALYELSAVKDKSGLEAQEQKRIVNDVLKEQLTVKNGL